MFRTDKSLKGSYRKGVFISKNNKETGNNNKTIVKPVNKYFLDVAATRIANRKRKLLLRNSVRSNQKREFSCYSRLLNNESSVMIDGNECLLVKDFTYT